MKYQQRDSGSMFGLLSTFRHYGSIIQFASEDYAIVDL
jgi:hypothetical protein